MGPWLDIFCWSHKNLSEILTAKMTPEQIAEAKEKVQIWTKAHENLTQ
jgi:hypothetical protein